jgi:hypothetical protein
VVALNVTLQPSGSVAGTINSASDVPVPTAQVGASTDGAVFDYQTTADPQGHYRIDKLPLGNTFLQARDPATLVSGFGFGTLATNLQTVTVNINLPPTASVQGRILTSGGASSVPNAGVSLESFASAGPLGTFRSFGTGDGLGNYQFGGVPIGGLRVTGSDPNNLNSIGFADGTLALPGPLVLNPQLGNAVHLGLANLDGADGFRYDVGCWGELHDGGTVDRRLAFIYAGAFFVSIQASSGIGSVPCLGSAGVDLSGRQITVGPSSTTGLNITRKVFVPSAGKFARYLEVLTNPTLGPITVDVAIDGRIGSDSHTRLVVDPATTSNTYAITDSNGTCCYSTLGFVIAGPNSAVPATGAGFANGSGDFGYRWHVTVPPGQTVMLMHFAIQRDVTDSAGATAMAQALTSLADSDALAGLTPAEKAQILNFRIP